MKTTYKYINFEKAGKIWHCKNNRGGEILCKIEYYGQWRRWVSGYHSGSAIFSSDCHDDISHFLQQLNAGGTG